MRRTFIIFPIFFLFALTVKGQNVQASVFFETFDGTAFVGGNDGDFSSSKNSFPIRYDYQHGWTNKANNKDIIPPSAGAQCVRLVGGNENECHIITPKINVKKGKIRLTFTAGLFNDKVNIVVKTTSNKTYTLTKGKMIDYENEINVGYDRDLTIDFNNQPGNSTKSFSYYFLDNVTLYQEESTDEQQKAAQRLILSGTFDESQTETLNNNIKDNMVIVDIDAKEATFPANTILTPGNKNCLIYASKSSNLSNENNLIIDSQCASLVIDDGDHENQYPFFAKEDFTALKASYNRDFSAALNGSYPSTVCLPFSFSTNNGAKLDKIYTLSAFDGSTLTFNETSDLGSNTPAVIYVNDAQPFKQLTNVNVKKTSCCMTNLTKSNNFTTFCGVYLYHNDIVSDQNTTAFGFSKGELKKITKSSNFQPFRAFFTILTNKISTSTAPSVKYQTPAGINNVTANTSPDHEKKNIFDLQGRSIKDLDHAKSGIYIVDHKKQYIKH